MNDQPTIEQRPGLHPATAIGALTLTVRDLERSVHFYQHVLGFRLLEQTAESATLAAGGTPLLRLEGRPEAPARPRRTTGLYHFAILVPSRPDLARSLRRLAEVEYPLGGHADHLVSEALYLSDPEGNGIEIYRDRPRDTWTWRGGEVQMAVDPIDLRGLLREAETHDRVWDGLPQGTRIGHMHLQVADLGQAEAFYHDVLGFDVVAHFPGALFVSAGGYHHHLGLNTWETRGAPRPPEGAAGLHSFEITLPDRAEHERVAGRLRAAGVAHEEQSGTIMVRDPWGNRILLVAEA